MTTPSVSLGEPTRTRSARGLGLWYQATRLARASASCRYRMGHLAELLQGCVTVVDPRPDVRRLRGLGIVVVVRPCLDEFGIEMLGSLRARGTRLIADFDDLLFAGPADEFPRVHSGEMSLLEAERLLEQYRRGLRQFDAFTVSTEPLADAVRELMPEARVEVVPNGVSRSWVEQGRALYASWRPGQDRTIRYLAGSPSHDRDFSVVVSALARFMREHSEVSLEVVGPLSFRSRDFPGDRISRARPVPYAELPRLIASSWVTLAPLSDTRFAMCKSANKFLESAAFGTPCVATPNPELWRHAAGGVRLARTEQDFSNALEALTEDGHRESVSQQSVGYVDSRGTAEESVRAFLKGVSRWGWADAIS